MKALFVITSDPRTSHRPAEAIRIAAGVGAWKKVQVSVYLYGEAARILDDQAGDFVDEEHFSRYLPMLQEGAGKVYVHKDEKEFARLAREHAVVTWF
jgi:sulfur relay (sulfurtransferase) DsrF/TusC family protein